ITLAADSSVRGASAWDAAKLEAVVAADSRRASLLLRRTAAQMRLLPWVHARDDLGRPLLLKKGPRRRLVTEALAARDLISFIQSKTHRHLYDEVGWLLWATFPSLGAWRSPRGKTRLRD